MPIPLFSQLGLATKMKFEAELFFLIPPPLNLILLLAPNTLFDVSLNGMATVHDVLLFLVAGVGFFIFIPFFLLTSIKLQIILSLNPPVLTFGDFSGPVALAVLASFRLSPHNFFPVYVTLIFISPWFGNLVNILKQSWLWLCHSLQSIPAFIIIPSQQQELHHQSLSTRLVSLQEAEADTAKADSVTSHGEDGLATEDSAASHTEDGLATNIMFNVELRFIVPLVLNLILFSVPNTLFNLFLNGMDGSHDVFLLLVAWLVFIIFILFFLLTSIKLPINLSLNPPVLTFGDFSGSLALAVLASFLLSPHNFFPVYGALIFISPWFGKLVNILKRSWLWLYHSLQSIPAFIIIPSQQQELNHQSLSNRLVSFQEAEADTATAYSQGQMGYLQQN